MAMLTAVPGTASGYSSGSINKRYLITVSAIVALGGILFGYDLVIISGAIPFLKEHFLLNEIREGWAVGCINIGAAAGSLIAGRLSDIFGRKKLLLFCAFLFAITGIGTGWAASFSFYVLCRIMSGVAVGIAALVCPVYISEIAPASIRGRLVTLYQLAITTGLLLAYITNYLLLGTGENNWRWMFSSQAIPAIAFLVGLAIVPESPRWLIGKSKIQKATNILTLIGGKVYAVTEQTEIARSFVNKRNEKFSDLWSTKYLPVIFMGIMIAVFSQAGGQNSLFSYTNIIFKQAGVAQDSAFLQSILLGVINFSMTFIALRTVDKTGRKKLLQYGAALLALIALCLALCFWWQLPGIFVLAGLLLFIGVFAATLGPVTWVSLSEIFPNSIRGNAMATATLFLWVANFFATALFPVMKKNFGLGNTFLIHACICIIYFLYVKMKVPETKDKSLEEIEDMLVQNKS